MPDETIFEPENVTDDTVDPIQKRLNDKDSFIAQLQSEMAELRADLKARLTLEELADKALRPAPAAPPQETVPPVRNADATKPDLSEEVKRILREETEASRRSANLEKTKTLLKEKFGENINTALNNAASILGVKDKWLTDMAAMSPEGLVKLVVDNQPQRQEVRPTAAPRSNVNTATALGNVVKKNKAYYDNLRQSDLTAYFSPKVQNEMMKEALEQGTAFYEP